MAADGNRYAQVVMVRGKTLEEEGRRHTGDEYEGGEPEREEERRGELKGVPARKGSDHTSDRKIALG